jgi:predicted RNA-binding Zn-ribbon protein involved in translation (DUF1610 family)
MGMTYEEFVATATEKFNGRYTYLRQGEYRHKERTVVYTCPEHGEVTQKFSQHLKLGCGKCGIKAANLAKRWNLEEWVAKIGDKFDHRYTYTSADKVGVITYIIYTCPEHGEIRQSFQAHLNSTYGCPKCSLRNMPVKQKSLPSEWDAKGKHLFGEKFLGTVLSSKPTMFRFVCDTHGETMVNAYQAAKGRRCKHCARENYSGGKRVRWTPEFETHLHKIHNNSYTYVGLSNTFGEKTHIMYECEHHGVVEQALNDHVRGHGCTKCAGRTSKGHMEIHEYLAGLGLAPQGEVRLGSSKFFWDIVIPEKSIAIEFHGLYWHSSKYRANNYHKIKHEEGLQVGYRTIHIFEDEWTNRKQQVKALLASAVGVNTSSGSTYARSCTISSVVASEAREFLEQHHVQGFRSGSHYIGLYNQGELVGVLGYEFRKSGRGQTTTLESMEITRYATSTHVVGGMSKLMSHLVKITPELKEVYSFSDIRMYSGNLYAACGFTQVYSTAPDYSYVVNGKRIHKSSYQKSRFKSDPNLQYADGLTEVELAELNNLYRIYDCGKVKWVKKVR